AGKVFINGRKAILGDKVSPEDRVELKEKVKDKFSYYAYNKPRGLITNKQEKGEKDIISSVSLKGIYPVGRLDKDSEGLILLTDNGRITDKLLNPIYDHDKEYIVKTRTPIKESQLRVMERGMDLEGDIRTKPCKTRYIDERTFSITLSEGKKHQIRRMCDAFTLPIGSLKRVRVMNIRLGDLKPGQYRKIEGEELKTLLKSLGVN
ncbi:MAG: pseudouridine synthase, partial [Candidatus Paceibacterota bacterium]